MITTCIRKDQKELKKKKARILLWPASFPSVCWHMKEACKVERISSVNGRPRICWRTEVKVAPPAPQSSRVALNGQPETEEAITGPADRLLLFQENQWPFSLQDWRTRKQISLAKIPSFPFYQDLTATQYATLASTFGSWCCPENNNQHLKVGPWRKGQECKGHKALDENHNSTTSCLRSELSELQIDPS